jgi:dihydrofolate reductase
VSCSIIAAVAANGAIGRDHGLPWHLPADLRHFKRLTFGHHLIVGRRTWESVGTPLPGRTMVVVTRDRGYRAEGVIVTHSLAEALRAARGDDEPFIGGGAGLYRDALEVADTMYLTRIHADFEADTFFPPFDAARWVLVSRESHEADEKNPYAYDFELLERVG